MVYICLPFCIKQLTGSANTDRENLQLSSKLLFGKDTYGLSGLSKISQGPRGKWNVDLIYPTRHIVLNAEGGRKRNTFETDFEVAWDKDKDESAKVGDLFSYNDNYFVLLHLPSISVV